MSESPMDIAKRNRWSEKIAQRIASKCLRWTENGALLDIQLAAAIIRAEVHEAGFVKTDVDNAGE